MTLLCLDMFDMVSPIGSWFFLFLFFFWVIFTEQYVQLLFSTLRSGDFCLQHCSCFVYKSSPCILYHVEEVSEPTNKQKLTEKKFLFCDTLIGVIPN